MARKIARRRRRFGPSLWRATLTHDMSLSFSHQNLEEARRIRDRGTQLGLDGTCSATRNRRYSRRCATRRGSDRFITWGNSISAGSFARIVSTKSHRSSSARASVWTRLVARDHTARLDPCCGERLASRGRHLPRHGQARAYLLTGVGVMEPAIRGRECLPKAGYGCPVERRIRQHGDLPLVSLDPRPHAAWVEKCTANCT
jgi:hypothetical protein